MIYKLLPAFETLVFDFSFQLETFPKHSFWFQRQRVLLPAKIVVLAIMVIISSAKHQSFLTQQLILDNFHDFHR